MIRDHLSRLLPTALKLRLRPLVGPLLERLERPRLGRLYRSFVAPGDLAFDVGAAAGFHTAVLRALGATVVAVEPNPDALARLRRRFACDPGVRIVAAGVADHVGQLPFFVSSGDPELSTFALAKWQAGRYAGRAWERPVVVPVLTLDRLIADHGLPAFVKVDVEGFEPEVVSGLHQRPRALGFEFTGELLEDAAASLRHLASLGPISCAASLGRRHRLLAAAWVGPTELLDRLAAQAERRPQGDIFVRWR